MGFPLYSIDWAAFTQVTTEPTEKQAAALAEFYLEEYSLDLEWEGISPDVVERWVKDPATMTGAIRRHLATPDWYGGLNREEVEVWNSVVRCMNEDDVKRTVKLKFRPLNDGALNWDVPLMAAAQGASSLAEGRFGHRGFRCFAPDPYRALNVIYSIHSPAEVQALLAELLAVEPFFATLPAGEDSEHEQFFEGLLKPVRKVAQQGRGLWVDVDT